MSVEKRLAEAIKYADVELINALFESIYYEYKGLVCFVIAKYVQERSEIDDILQETFIEVFNHIENITGSLKTYLTTIAKNKTINYLKKKKRYTIVEMTEIDLLANDIVQDNYPYVEIINSLKNNLSHLEFQILCLHLFDGLTFKEISQKLAIKESTTKSKYFRTLEKSRKILRRSN